jgi:hypothetical protein
VNSKAGSRSNAARNGGGWMRGSSPVKRRENPDRGPCTCLRADPNCTARQVGISTGTHKTDSDNRMEARGWRYSSIRTSYCCTFLLYSGGRSHFRPARTRSPKPVPLRPELCAVAFFSGVCPNLTAFNGAEQCSRLLALLYFSAVHTRCERCGDQLQVGHHAYECGPCLGGSGAW